MVEGRATPGPLIEFNWGIHMAGQEVRVHDCVVRSVGSIIAKLRGGG